MEKTIFEEIKDALDVNTDEKAFDTELELLLSSVFATLAQLGVHDYNFIHFHKDLTWEEFRASSNKGNFDLVKSYILLKTRLAFDPPTASALQYTKEHVSELEWRIKESYSGDYTNDK